MHLRKGFASLVVGLVVFAGSASADVITYIIGYDQFSADGTPGSFSVWAAVDDDSTGLAQYAVEIIGAESFQNVAPVVGFDPDFGGGFGFDFTRTGNNVSPLSGAQNTTDPAKRLITGIGKDPGNLDPNGNGFNAVRPEYGAVSVSDTQGITYDAPVLLAVGTYTQEAQPTIGLTSGLTFQVTDPVGGTPGIALPPTGGINTATAGVVIPEPAALTLFTLALVGWVGFCRRRG
jgi:hypothetical protein